MRTSRCWILTGRGLSTSINRDHAAVILHFTVGRCRERPSPLLSEERLSTKIAAKAVLSGMLLCGAAEAQAPSPSIDVERLVNHPKFKAAQNFIDRDHDRFVREIIQITEIEAPPFKEDKRGKAYLEMLRQNGLAKFEMDPEGNEMDYRKGDGFDSLMYDA